MSEGKILKEQYRNGKISNAKYRNAKYQVQNIEKTKYRKPNTEKNKQRKQNIEKPTFVMQNIVANNMCGRANKGGKSNLVQGMVDSCDSASAATSNYNCLHIKQSDPVQLLSSVNRAAMTAVQYFRYLPRFSEQC